MKERGYRGSCRIHEDVLSSENSLSARNRRSLCGNCCSNRGVRDRWPFALASFSNVPAGRATPRWPPSCAPQVSPWACGGIVLSPGGWLVWVTRCARERHGRSAMTVSSGPYASPWKRLQGATHWSSRALAARTGLSQSTVSRMNQVERWFALLSQRQIKRGSHYSVRELESAILEFIDVHNEQSKPFVWTKSADAILNSIGRFASRTLAAHGTNNMQEISDSGD